MEDSFLAIPPSEKGCDPYGEGFHTMLYDAEGPGVGLGLLFYRLVCTILLNQKHQPFLMSLRRSHSFAIIIHSHMI